MSNLESVKVALREWISGKVRIDEWDLDVPRFLYSPSSTEDDIKTAVTAVEYPAKSIDYEQEGQRQISGFAACTFSLVFRYPGVLTEEQLPVSDLESINEFLKVTSLLELSGCDGIRRADTQAIEYPVQISRMDDDQSDWLLYLHIIFEVQFSVTEASLPNGYESEGATELDPFSLEEINLKIFRSLTGDLGTNTLDSDLTISKEI